MSERDALLLDYPMDDDDLVAADPSANYNTSAHNSRGQRRANSMSLQTLHTTTQSSTDEDMITDAGPYSSPSAASK